MALKSVKPLPDADDPEVAPFWAATGEGRLLIRLCDECGQHHWPPRIGCPYCGSGEVDWAGAPTRGRIFSWTVVHRSQTQGFEDDVPYAVLLVELDGIENVRMVGNLANADLDAIEAGLEVEAVFAPSPDGSVTLVHWQPAESQARA
jgi:uncharacterized OB-fold protein